MFTRITLLLFLSCNLAFAQDLAVSAETVPSFCRTAGFQSGGGVVYATAFGGTPGYTYLWTNLATGVTSGSSTWGGLNPGNYEIEVTDMSGNSVSQIVLLDSLNPISSFEVLTDEVEFTPSGYIGFAPLTIEFKSTSENVVPIIDPTDEPRFYWQLRINPDGGGAGDYVISDDQYEVISNYYGYGGAFDVCLTVQNDNGCSDTTCAKFGLFGTMVGLEENTFNGSYTLKTSLSNKALNITTSNMPDNVAIRIVSLNGQEIYSSALQNGLNQIPFDVPLKLKGVDETVLTFGVKTRLEG